MEDSACDRVAELRELIGFQGRGLVRELIPHILGVV